MSFGVLVRLATHTVLVHSASWSISHSSLLDFFLEGFQELSIFGVEAQRLSWPGRRIFSRNLVSFLLDILARADSRVIMETG